MRSTLLLLAFSIPLAAGEAAKPEVEPAWSASVRSITLSTNWHAQDGGGQENQQFSLNVRVEIPPGAAVVGHLGFLPERFATDKGEIPLPRREQRQSSRYRERISRHDDQRGIQAHFSVPQLPQAGATKILELSGTIEVDISTGPGSEARLAPISAFLGKEAVIENQEGLTVSILENDKNRLRIRVPYDSLRSEDISFRDAAGNALRAQHAGSNGNGQSTTFEYRQTLPADGAVVIALPAPTRRQKVKIRIVDVPLPRLSGPDSAAAINVKPVPTEPAGKASPVKVTPLKPLGADTPPEKSEKPDSPF
jgi:hypothetical protein